MVDRSPAPVREEGSSLIAVIGISFVMLILVSAVLTSAFSGFRRSVESEDFHASLAAAEAGIADFIYRLNQDGNYWQYQTTAASPDGNGALDGFVPLPGASSNASFTYSTDITEIAAQGTVGLTVVGQVGDTQRQIDVTVRRRSFLDYLYFTDLETQDPGAMYITDATQTDMEDGSDGDSCLVHRYTTGSPTRQSPPCREIVFFGDGNTGPGADRDRIRGPLHSNDSLLIRGNPIFEGEATSSWRLPIETDEGPDDPDLDRCVGERYVVSGSANPEFQQSCIPSDGATPGPAYASPLVLPPSNDEIRNETRADVGRTGCLLTGPTVIQLLPGQRMNVTSPMSQSGNCADDLVHSDPWDHYASTNLPLPANGVIFVQNVPADPGDVNAVSGCTYPTNSAAFAEVGWADAHPFAFQMSNNLEMYRSGGTNQYGRPRLNEGPNCRAGDVWIWGETDGQVTIAAEGDINVVSDLTVVDRADNDVIGLVADNFVSVYHPVGCDDVQSGNISASIRARWLSGEPSPNSNAWRDFICAPDASSSQNENVAELFTGRSTDPLEDFNGSTPTSRYSHDLTIEAAILSINHSFRVSMWADGDEMGDLTVLGAIGQRFRGIVGLVNTTGYIKDYVYDERLRYLQPPHFIDPVASAWQVNTWAEGVVGS